MGKIRLVLLGALIGQASVLAQHEAPANGGGGALDKDYAAKAQQVEKLFAFIGKGEPGCSVNVLLDGLSVYKKSFGVLRKGKDTPATPDTRYNIASTTKPIVALGILKLREEILAKSKGDLLAYRLKDVFTGGFKDAALGNATVRDLLTHATGLGGTYPYQGPGLSDASLAQRIAKASPATYYPPGNYYHYSNAGYAMLGAIAEKLSGQSLHDFLDSRFFRPLGMTKTSVHHPKAYVDADDVAWGHEEENKEVVVRPFVDDASGTLGDGGMFTTAEDMGKLAVALDRIQEGKSPLLKAESLRLAFQSAGLKRAVYEEEERSGYYYKVKAGSPVNYGLGWSVYPPQLPDPPNPGTRYHQWHGGYYAGSRAMFARLQKENPPCRLSTILLCNGPGPTPYDLSSRIEDIYCPR